MNTLLRIYLVLIFVSSARSAGLENESANEGISLEAFNFAKPGYPQNLQGLADCMNYSILKEYNASVVLDTISQRMTLKR